MADNSKEYFDALIKTIAAKKKEQPLIGAMIASQEITTRLVDMLKDQRGVHIESLLSILGALAGYACQVSVREELGVPKTTPEEGAFTIVTGKDGKRYFFGDSLNKPMMEVEYSVWGLTGGGVVSLGKTPPDIEGIFKHVAATVGTEQFGIPRVPPEHAASALPITYLNKLWPRVCPFVKQFCNEPHELPIAFGFAIQEAIVTGKDVIDPVMAATIVMESAIPMSKIELQAL